jgi:hypothetical protein
LPVDPSSACQRLFNAAIHDLRDKIVRAGLDIAKEAADQNRLPPVSKSDDILDNYSTANVIDLAYRMGLLKRPEWRRLRRAYDIRRDLEHEDDEYEAEIADCIYIFTASIELVLSRDPVELLRVADVRELVESPEIASPTLDFLRDYESAPETRQKEITKYLIAANLTEEAPDAVCDNALEVLARLEPLTKNPVKIDLATHLQGKAGRKLSLSHVKIAAAGGFVHYLKQPLVEDFFKRFAERLNQIGYRWQHYSSHAEILDDLEDCGGLIAVPPNPRREMVIWMTLCYLGERGGYGTYGRNRAVFYSDAGAIRIEGLFKSAASVIADDLAAAVKTNRIKDAVENKHVARRYEKLLDIIESADAGPPS